MKVLAIDFGERRIGLAMSDGDSGVAVPLATVLRRSDRQAVSEIGEISRREKIDLLIVGEPVNMDGSRGESARRAASFARKLGEKTGVEVVLIDERLTSRAARERLLEAGVDLKRHRERIDAVAAQLLLEDYLDREQHRDRDD